MSDQAHTHIPFIFFLFQPYFARSLSLEFVDGVFISISFFKYEGCCWDGGYNLTLLSGELKSDEKGCIREYINVVLYSKSDL